jgi:hypothetical protein
VNKRQTLPPPLLDRSIVGALIGGGTPRRLRDLRKFCGISDNRNQKRGINADLKLLTHRVTRSFLIPLMIQLFLVRPTAVDDLEGDWILPPAVDGK